MTTLLSIAVINAVTVVPLALLAFAVGRWAHRPALTHLLWVLILLKFVTPPLFNLPVTIDVPLASPMTIDSEPVEVAVANPNSIVGDSASIVVTTGADGVLTSSPTEQHTGAHVTREAASALVLRSGGDGQRDAQSQMSLLERGSAFCVQTISAGAVWCTMHPSLQSLLLMGWLAGTVVWIALQITRAVRFQRRVLRHAVVSAELQQQTERLAAKLGLRRAPQVLVVDAAVSPMLWGCGARAKLLFPADLADRLEDEARATLLAHELAHFSRGDHWVRVLELVATALFWWHPVVWWARQQIEESEEECCDAWVVGEFPETPRQYAEALLDAIDFLCESRQTLPPVASGLGQAPFLRRRLAKIMLGTAPKRLSHRLRCAVALVAACLLPLQPFVFGSPSPTNLRARPAEWLLIDTGLSTPSSFSPGSADFGSSMSGANETLPPSSPMPETSTNNSTGPRAARGEHVLATAASPDGRFVIRKTSARRVVLTDLVMNRETDLSEHRITAVSFAPEGDWFATADHDGRISIWNAERAEWLRTILTHSEGLRSIAVSPLGNAIAAGCRDGSVLLCDPETGRSLVNLPSYSLDVNCVRFSPDGRQLAIALGNWMPSKRSEVVLLSAISGRQIATLPCASSPGALAFASNEELIVGLWDGQTQLWNLVDRHVVASVVANKNVVDTATFSPDNPVLREVTFVAAEPVQSEDQRQPVPLLQELFSPATSSTN